ncbi:hypothetical protein ACQPWY_14120 [Pseudonocardia xinjiangensis]|uniref:hypothetical protein n=1 Tax=Pseudonocardia xinjiangensis TaxID=75289 RepID=UPI003D8FFAF7
MCFQGQTVGVTSGFTIDEETRAGLIRKAPDAAKYIHPFMGGDDLLHSTSLNRHVTDLPQADALETARDAPGLMTHVRDAVLPQRESAAQKENEQNAERLAADPKARLPRHHRNFLDRWWQPSYRRSDMVTAVESLTRYVDISRVT